jgi:hypothetical protein
MCDGKRGLFALEGQTLAAYTGSSQLSGLPAVPSVSRSARQARAGPASSQIRDVSEHCRPQLKGKRDYPLLAAFAVQCEQHVVHVDVTHADAEGFADAAAGIKQELDEQV